MHPTVLEIDLGALTHNYNYLRSKLSPTVKMMAVVKAFGYGSEAVAVAQKLEALGIDYFAVAYASEGVALRDAGIRTPILVLHPQPVSFDHIIDRCLEPSIYSFRVLELFLASAERKNQKDYPVHLKFNTGLNRLGFGPQQTEEVLDQIADKATVRVRSVFSHLVASEDLKLQDFTLNQIETFSEVAKKIQQRFKHRVFLHQSNTSAIINFPQAQFDLVRTGIGLYGYGNTPEEDEKLMPVATLKSIISQIHQVKEGDSVGYNRAHFATKEERIAVIPIGHADGISRAFGKGKGYVTIAGKQAPIVGNVCMDMLMVDVTGIDCEEGDNVEIFGKNASAVDLAARINSIPYELITAISQRIPRKLIG
ncbi:MAG: alanine racemase [Leeuwenhoekiella sp.]